MVFITLVCGYLSSTLLKINAEQIIELSSQNLGKDICIHPSGRGQAAKFGKSPVLPGLGSRGEGHPEAAEGGHRPGRTGAQADQTEGYMCLAWGRHTWEWVCQGLSCVH